MTMEGMDVLERRLEPGHAGTPAMVTSVRAVVSVVGLLSILVCCSRVCFPGFMALVKEPG